MHLRLQNKLRDDYPFLNSCEFYIPDGWFVIIFRAMAQVHTRIEDTGYGIRANVISVRRDASLSIGIECDDDVVEQIIENTELMAETTCMICGALGKRRKPSFMEIRCNKHQDISKQEVLTKSQIDKLIAATLV